MDDYPHIATAVGSWLSNEHNSFWSPDREIDFFLFCQDFLSAVYVSPSVVFLGLKYMQRYLNNQDICDTNERQVFAVSIRLAYKYLEDDSLCPKTYCWSTITHTSSLDLLHLEQQFLLNTAYDLSLIEYAEWVDHCRTIASTFCLNPAILYYPHTISLVGSSSSAAPTAPPLIYDIAYDDTIATSIIPMEDEDEDEEDEDYKLPFSIAITRQTKQEQPYNLTSQPIDTLAFAFMDAVSDNIDSSGLPMSMMALAPSEAAELSSASNGVYNGQYSDAYYCCPQDMINDMPYGGHCEEDLAAARHPAMVRDYNYCRLSANSLLFQPYYYPALAPPLPNPAMIIDQRHC